MGKDEKLEAAERRKLERMFDARKRPGRNEVHAIRKVSVLPESVAYYAREMGLKPNDLVIVSIEKVRGSPIDFLEKRYAKKKEPVR